MFDLRKGHNCTTGKCKSYGGTEKSIVISDKKKTYKLINDENRSIEVLNLDDCVFEKHNVPNFKLCDYLIKFSTIEEKEKKIENLVWLELKGGANLGQACKQILNAYENVETGYDGNSFARIVLLKVNNNSIKGDSYKRLFQIFGRRLDYAGREYNKDKSSKLFLR